MKEKFRTPDRENKMKRVFSEGHPEERTIRILGESEEDRMVVEVDEEDRAGNQLTPQRKVVMVDGKDKYGAKKTKPF